MADAVKRCFLGIDLPEPVRNSLAAWCAEHHDEALRGKWVAPRNYHLTLRFLGDVNETQIRNLDTLLGPACAECLPLRCQVTGIGAFPHIRDPRVLWASAVVDTGRFAPLVRVAENAAQALGLAAETRPCVPHVTLLRLRAFPPGGLSRTLLDAGARLTTDAFQVSAVALWESTRRPEGLCYMKLKEYPRSW